MTEEKRKIKLRDLARQNVQSEKEREKSRKKGKRRDGSHQGLPKMQAQTRNQKRSLEAMGSSTSPTSQKSKEKIPKLVDKEVEIGLETPRTPQNSPTRPEQNLQAKAQAKKTPHELFTNFKYPSAYSGDLQRFILENDAISRHRRRIYKFDRRKTRVNGPYTAIQVDTM
jgi:uncharacterized sporulation protein YeaH/YhbH (DUF444 family)